MPGFDKTGPQGRGALSGRGLGTCGKAIFSSKKMRLVSFAVPVCAAILNDVRNPLGITRRLYTSVTSRLSGKNTPKIEGNSDDNPQL